MEKSDSADISSVTVLIPQPPGRAYDYALPVGYEDQPLERGRIVDVPLGPRTIRAVVWGPGQGDVDPDRLKPIADVPDIPAFPASLCDLIDWIAAYTVQPPGIVLRLAMAMPNRWQEPKPQILYGATGQEPDRMTPARKRVLAQLNEGPALRMADVTEMAGVSSSVIKGLVKQGAVEEIVAHARPPALPDADHDAPGLTDHQRAAADALCEHVGPQRQDGFSVSLLEGITGSGKTETYFESVAATLRGGEQALILMPEIALTAQFLDRFEARFGVRPLEWHSDLSLRQRQRVWSAVASGQPYVVVGARSALFLPFQNLGLIIVDEEHEGAYKQDEGVTYHGRDMAIVRGQLGAHPVILASATPSLESALNAARGRYHHVQLTERYGEAVLPSINLLDLREHTPEPGQFLSRSLVQRAVETIGRGEQALFFLNRRGYAPLTLCRTCGHRIQCKDCDSWLVEHRFRRKLQCHHCGYQEPVPRVCPSCEAEDSMVPIGPGVERVAEELTDLLPQARITVLSSDFLARDRARLGLTDKAAARRSIREMAQERIRQFADGAFDIMIGTQIVAKGHNFPNLTLVGVVDADLGLSGGDLRAAERTFQLMTQVAGRAGRAEKPGQVWLQSYDPDHPVMKALGSGDAQAFQMIDAQERQQLGMPPFGRLAGLLLTGPDRGRVEDAAREMARAAPRGQGISLFGPAEAPIAMIRGRYRMRLLLKTTLDIRIQPLLATWVAAVKLPSNVRLQIDVDPHDFM
ncbi:MAG: primosomal protein N' [Alphaproteobacteria bacterium]